MIVNNDQRAQRVADLIRGYSGDDLATDMKDALGDLRHLADALGLNFDQISGAGYRMYCTEIHEDGGPATSLDD